MWSFFKKEKDAKRHLIMIVDKDPQDLKFLVKCVNKSGHEPLLAESGAEALSIVKAKKPNLIFVEVMAPDINGFEICSRLHSHVSTAYIPVILVIEEGEEQSRTKAFQVGAADYLVKPLKKSVVMKKIKTHVKTTESWDRMSKLEGAPAEKEIESDEFIQFKEFLVEKLELSEINGAHVSMMTPSALYSICSKLKISHKQVAQLIAEFLELPYEDQFDAENVLLGMLPTRFCKPNHVIAIETGEDQVAIVHSNPFIPRLEEALKDFTEQNPSCQLVISDPNIVSLLWEGPEYEELF